MDVIEYLLVREGWIGEKMIVEANTGHTNIQIAINYSESVS